MTSAPITVGAAFGYPILAARAFDDVLRGVGSPLALADVDTRMRTTGRLLLQARGGAGKSFTARRIAALHAEEGIGVAFVQAWTLSVSGEDGTPPDFADILAHAEDPAAANMVQDTGEGLVVIDGINEIPRAQADAILAWIPFLGAQFPFVRFLITDRLTRRDVDQETWLLATLGPVPEGEARAYSGQAVGPLPEHLTIPYYLSRSRDQGDSQSEVQILHGAVVEHGGVPGSILPILAAAAYDNYARNYDRVVNQASIERAVGSDVLARMTDSGLLVGDQDASRFSHHLVHDYLAALHLSQYEEFWTPAGFDVVTLKASSFDALSLAAALVDPGQRVDELVHRVFDWNYYGAAYLLEEDQYGEQRIWEAMRTAILAMLAEKLFDRMVVTADRVRDALRLQDNPLGHALLEANDRDAVVRIVEHSLPQDWEGRWPAWFKEWYVTFRCPSGATATTESIERVASPIGTVGWAASNMLKRLKVSDAQRRVVLEMAAAHQNDTVRWRAVHVLGAWPSEEVVDTLLGRIRDPKEALWVRYGALRSLLEAAAGGTSTLRRRVFKALGTHELAEVVLSQPQLRKEALRALEIGDMPANWHALAGDFLERLFLGSEIPSERDEVVALAHRLRLSPKVAS